VVHGLVTIALILPGSPATAQRAARNLEVPKLQVQKLQLRIAAGSAPVALAEFIQQTGLQVLFESDAIRNHTTRAVNGQFDAQEALALMLQDSGLMFELINSRTISVKPRPVAAKRYGTATDRDIFLPTHLR
jgi:hypothetical protein